MKSTITIITALTLLSINAHADDSARVLNHEVVKGTFKIMQSIHSSKCTYPTENSISWRCFGEEPASVTQPTVIEDGCVFQLEFGCENETITMNGKAASYSVAMPGGKIIPAKSNLFSASDQIIFYDLKSK